MFAAIDQKALVRKVALGLVALGVILYPYLGGGDPSPSAAQPSSTEESSTVTVSRTSTDIVVRLGDSTSREVKSREVTTKRATFYKE